VSPGVGTRHLENLKNPEGLNPRIHKSVHVYFRPHVQACHSWSERGTVNPKKNRHGEKISGTGGKKPPARKTRQCERQRCHCEPETAVNVSQNMPGFLSGVFFSLVLGKNPMLNMGNTICMDSGVLRVACGNSGATAPPLAARLVVSLIPSETQELKFPWI